MNLLINALYWVTLCMIRLFGMFISIVAYIGFKPIKAHVNTIFNDAGIVPNGVDTPKMVIRNDWFYHRLACDGTLGLAETYLNGWWDCKRLDDFFDKALKTDLYQKTLFPWDKLINHLHFNVFNLQTVERSNEVADKHYNLGNYLFKSFLDVNMNYSCAYWNGAKNLDEAQLHKMELIGRKLKLKPGMRVLDVGCGWGGLCKFLAETYNVDVVGVTNSKECAKESRLRCKGLQVDIRLQDYRETNGRFDRVVSVEFMEHVGPKNYRSFFEIVHRCLSDDGIFLFQTSGHDNDSVPQADYFLNKYIFPNGILPNHKNIPKAIDNLFCIEEWVNFGPHYDKTLMAWHENFVKNWPTISHNFDNPEFVYRMWTYYFSSCAAVFRWRKVQLWQIVFTKGLSGGYTFVR